VQTSKNVAGDCSFVAISNEAKRRGDLSFGTSRDLVSDHTTHFVSAANTAGCKPHHAKSNDILCVKPKLYSLEGQREPGIEQGASIVEGEAAAPQRAGDRAR
jgi:hypothetical protein